VFRVNFVSETAQVELRKWTSVRPCRGRHRRADRVSHEGADGGVHLLRLRRRGHRARADVYWRKLRLKAQLESTVLYISFERSDPRRLFQRGFHRVKLYRPCRWPTPARTRSPP